MAKKHLSQRLTLIPDDPNDPRYDDPPSRMYVTAQEPDPSAPVFEPWSVRARSATGAYKLLKELYDDDQVHLVGWEVVVSDGGSVTVAGEITDIDKTGLTINLEVIETHVVPCTTPGYGTTQGPPGPGKVVDDNSADVLDIDDVNPPRVP